MEYFDSNAPFYIQLDPKVQENLYIKFGISNINDFSGKNLFGNSNFHETQ